MDLAALAQFLADLAENNNKPWFEANRSRYDTLRAHFTDLVDEVIFGVAAFDRHVQGVTAKDAIYRIYRDVRFSKDKSPYKTTFSAAIPRNMTGAGYYFQFSEEAKLMVAAGWYMPDNDTLAKIRQSIAAHPGQLQAVLDDPTFKKHFGSIEGPSLQRPPRGFDDSSPMLDLIKLKSYTVGEDFPIKSVDGDNLGPFIVKKFRAAYPLVRWLRTATGIHVE